MTIHFFLNTVDIYILLFQALGFAWVGYKMRLGSEDRWLFSFSWLAAALIYIIGAACINGVVIK